MEWTQEKRDGYSVYRSGQYTLEPEDLDFDEWSLYHGKVLVCDGTFNQCKDEAMAHKCKQETTE